VNSADALRIGLADQVLPGPRPSFEDMVLAHARRLAGHDDYYRLLERKRAARAAEERRRGPTPAGGHSWSNCLRRLRP
jgi:enoyl-CoA hydratase/carnithine racemase